MAVAKQARFVYRTGFGLCGMLQAVTVLLLRALAATTHNNKNNDNNNNNNNNNNSNNYNNSNNSNKKYNSNNNSNNKNNNNHNNNNNNSNTSNNNNNNNNSNNNNNNNNNNHNNNNNNSRPGNSVGAARCIWGGAAGLVLGAAQWLSTSQAEGLGLLGPLVAERSDAAVSSSYSSWCLWSCRRHRGWAGVQRIQGTWQRTCLASCSGLSSQV
ncbi:unnamed protein product [Polarella glacialis]|uniref:Uncharacterized protein n=1 Tax=Polarella glacialis TaxID=89957 RepID=A0A813HIH9_POLGL|nr:unnamed protein product [Polarella glacialis]